MFAPFSAVVAAASAGPVFNSEDMHDLDALIRQHHPSAFPTISAEDLEILRLRLNTIASLYRTQEKIGRPPTVDANLKNMRRVERHAVSLLRLLGASPTSDAREIHFEHITDGGIFEEPDVPFDDLIESLQTIATCAREHIRVLATSADRQIKEPDYYRRRLYDDLASEYKSRWGQGYIRFGVNRTSGGGPAVRFLEFTLQRILKRTISAAAIKEMISAMKADHEQGFSYSMFNGPEEQKG